MKSDFLDDIGKLRGGERNDRGSFSLSGKNMEKFGDPIESFRTRRERELFEHRFSVRAAEAQREVLRLIEHSERSEELAKQIAREMEEFFKDSTRLAARIFGSIEEKEAHLIEVQVAREMREFLVELTRKAELLAKELSATGKNTPKIENAIEDLLQSTRDPLEKATSHAAESLEG